MRNILIVFAIILYAAVSMFAQNATNYERLRAFSSMIGDVNTKLDDLIAKYGEDYSLEEEYASQESFPNSEEGSKIYKYTFRNGAVFIFYQNPGMNPFLMAWIVQPGFSDSVTIPNTIEVCRRWFGKEHLLQNNKLYYFYEESLVFTFEDGELTRLSWSSYD